MSEPEVYISVVFTDKQEQDVRAAMQQFGMHWADLVRIDNPDYHQWPYQVRLIFKKRPVLGDQDYSDWKKGDVFVHDDDPHSVQVVAREVDHEGQLIIFIDPEQGESFARFSAIRRVVKRSGR